METFNYTVEASPSKSIAPNVSKVSFGDGYEQRNSKGINIIKQVWDITFNYRDSVEGAAIDAFLTRHEGVLAFLWTPPFQDTPLKFVCDSWKFTPRNGKLSSISTQFRQVFEP